MGYPMVTFVTGNITLVAKKRDTFRLPWYVLVGLTGAAAGMSPTGKNFLRKRSSPLKRKRIKIHLSSSLVWLTFPLLVLALVTPLRAQTPVGDWKFDEGSGTRAADSSGNAHTALLSNGFSWAKGADGGAISANAANRDSVSIPAIDLSGTRAVTIAFWAKRIYSISGKDVLFEATTNYQNSTTGFAFLPDDELCQGIQAALRGNEGTTANCYSQPSSGIWHHLAVVFDKGQTGGGEVAFYVDGVLQTPSWSVSASTNTNSFGNNPVYLFSRGGTSKFSSGTVDDLRIYNRALTAAQIQELYDGPINGSGGSITLDGNVHRVRDNGSTPSYTAVVSIGTPTAGDLITCEVTFDGHNSNAVVSVADNRNGTYGAAVSAHLNTTLVQWFGIYYRENVAGSPTTVTLTTTHSQPWEAISCQAWKGVASSHSLDSGFVQSRDGLWIPNPTTGANKTPAVNGELVMAGAGLYSSGTPTAGQHYSLIDSAAASQWWPEYWIQTTATATAANYIWPSDSWTDMMAAFRPSAATGNFTISASPNYLNITQGNQGTATISTTISGGFSSSISLSASGVPTGTTVGFNPPTIPAPGSGQSTMTVTVGANTPPGTYPITVKGTGGGIQQSTIVSLTVTAASTFTISASPSSLTVMHGNFGTSTITTAISGGFDSAISLSAAGMPAGTTVNFNPSTISAPGAGNSTMTITVGSSTPTGTYPITVTGNGGGMQQMVVVNLTVTAQVILSWTPSVSGGIAGYNAYRSTTSGGPYAKLNSSLIPTTNYNDLMVRSGSTYYYVTTAVNNQQMESSYSNQATATVP